MALKLKLYLFLLVTGCLSSAFTIPKITTSHHSKKSINSYDKGDYKLIQIFRNKKNNELGELYVKFTKGDIFGHLRIIQTKTGITDTLYFVDKNKFSNSKGIDIQVGKGDFAGYKIVTKNMDSVMIEVVNKNGVGISDYITIGWNYTKNLFEVLREP